MSLTADLARAQMRQQIAQRFSDLLRQVRDAGGSLTEIARQLGVKRQVLDQYANGSVPGADVLLLALRNWRWTIRVEDQAASPNWYEFSMSNSSGTIQPVSQPVQLSLFDAITDLDQQINVLKKSVGRVETEIEKALKAG